MNRLIGLFCVIVFSLQGLAQDKVYAELERAFQRGDEKTILAHVGDKLLLEIDSKEKVYSHAQAELILRDFFHKNKPSSFKLIFKGNAKGSVAYAVGILDTPSKKFRVTITLKENQSVFKIEQMSMEEE